MTGRFLVALHDDGGNLALILPILRELVARGHEVRVLAGSSARAGRRPLGDRAVERIAATGAHPIVLAEPSVHPYDVARSRGLARGWTPRWLIRMTANCRPLAWCPVWAAGIAAELRRAPADVVVVDFVLLGAAVGAEAMGVPVAVLVHGIYKHRPARGVPPYGTAWRPARTWLERLRDRVANAAIEHVYRRDGLPPLARARREAGLAPLPSPFEQFDRADRVLILASPAFDFVPRQLPRNVRYVGAPLEDAGDVSWRSPWPADDQRPLILVSLSTMAQGQRALMQRILDAVGRLPVRAIVTLGPSLDAAGFTAPPNAVLETFVPHAAVLPLVTALVTQCGFGTVAQALAHGLPLVCLPLVGDQPANGARVVARGAGILLRPDASADAIARAIELVVTDRRFADAAARLATVLSNEDAARAAATELEGLVPTRRSGSAPTDQP